MHGLRIVTQTGTPRTTWCDRCLTSAGIEVDVHLLTPDGPLKIGTWHGCDRCGPATRQPTGQ